jgi:gluconate kinase
LTAAEFYRLTPRQFDSLLRHHRARQREQREFTELLFGQLTAAVYNSGLRGPQEPYAPRDFMPSQWAQIQAEKEEEDAAMAAERMRTTMVSFAAFQNAMVKQNG